MAKIQTTRWSPDTCGCVIEYSWDSDVAPEARVHTFKKTVEVCPAHAAHKDLNTHYSTVLEENRRKNYTLADAAEIAGVDLSPTPEKVKTKIAGRTFDTEDDKIVFEHALLEGQKARAKEFIENYSYSFDADRNLVISHPQLSTDQKAALKAITDTKHGANKVKVT
jgi:hypothetical protein